MEVTSSAQLLAEAVGDRGFIDSVAAINHHSKVRTHYIPRDAASDYQNFLKSVSIQNYE
jgi:hypothetical protein